MQNLFDLTGKVALITGGNGGIGLGIARGLSRAGAHVAIVGRDAEKSKAALGTFEETGSEILALMGDVSREDEVAAIVRDVRQHFGRVDILFNNAGITVRKAPQDVSLEEWRGVIDVNLTAAFLMARAVYPGMKAAGGGKIVNIGSMNSLFGSPYATAYAASKGAIVQLTKSLALSWAPDHIQVNCILPGWFHTAMTERARAEVPGLNERVLARVPAGRWARPEDIVGTAVWLSAPASDFVTGVAVPVDGGYSASP